MKLSFEQGIAAGVAGLVATALIAGVLLVDHGAVAAPLEASAQAKALPAPSGDAGACSATYQFMFRHGRLLPSRRLL